MTLQLSWLPWSLGCGWSAGFSRRVGSRLGPVLRGLLSRPGQSWLVCALVWHAGGDARAETIDWFCVPGSTCLTSAGVVMGDGYSFELGVFSGSFVPSAANTAQWAANWVPAQRVDYNPQNRFFTGRFTVVSNASPFTLGKAAYVWGFRGGSAAAEWILFRKSTWTWPAPDSIPNPTHLSWETKDATAILGTIDADGSPFLMQSAAVTGAATPPTTWQQWQAAELAGEPLNGPMDDPDHDGTVNLLEFVFGTPPKQAGAPTVTPVEMVTVSGQQYLQLTIPRRIDHVATLTVQVSADLTNWDSGPAFTVVVSDTQAALVVRDLTPLGTGAPRRFMRLQAEVPAP